MYIAMQCVGHVKNVSKIYRSCYVSFESCYAPQCTASYMRNLSSVMTNMQDFLPEDDTHSTLFAYTCSRL